MANSTNPKALQIIANSSRWVLLTFSFATILCALTFAEDGKQEIAPGKIKFRDHAGATVLSLKPKDDGAKLVDADEKELARYTQSGKKTKIKDSDDRVLGYIAATSDTIRLESADQKSVVCTLRHQAGGGWKIYDAEEKHVESIESHKDGAEVTRSAGKSLGKVKVKGGKTELRDANDKVVYATHESVSAMGMGCVGLGVVTDVRIRMGLLFALEQQSKKETTREPK